MTWRSLLFVPANQPAKVAKAVSIGADAVILDLEDSVPDPQKAPARESLGEYAPLLAQAGATVLVRINVPWFLAIEDLAAAVRVGAQAIIAPKAEDVRRLAVIAEMLAEAESASGRAPSSVGLIPLVESPSGTANLSAIAGVDRVVGLAFGSEDFAAAMGAPPSGALLEPVCRALAIAGASRGVPAFAVPASIAAYRDEDGFRAAAELARAFGVSGALCVHPNQVRIANAVFRPSDQDLETARDIVAAWRSAQARGEGVVTVAGVMIDPPVAARAEALLRRATGGGPPPSG